MSEEHEVKGKVGKSISDELWQPEVIYQKKIRVGFHQETIPFPFICNNVFRDDKEALQFLPFFIAGLIKNGDVPENVIIKDDNNKDIINENILKPCLMKLHMTMMEEKNQDGEMKSSSIFK